MRIEQSWVLEEELNAFKFTWDLRIGDTVVISGRDFGIRPKDARVRNLTRLYALRGLEAVEVAVASA
jgi:hypothetical protein